MPNNSQATQIDQKERYSRQADLVPVDRLAGLHISVIGVGAIGRQVALQLAAMGAPEIQLVDFDTVETGNLAAQGFMETDLGKPKVEAVAELCRKINSSINIHVENCRFSRAMPIGNVIFCCVDKIDIREFIWEALQDQVDLFIDGRMSAEALRILVAFDTASKDLYRTTLFRPEEAFTGTCTAKTTIYSSNVAAGLMLAQFAKWLRKMPLDRDIQFSLLTNELSVDQPASTAW